MEPYRRPTYYCYFVVVPFLPHIYFIIIAMRRKTVKGVVSCELIREPANNVEGPASAEMEEGEEEEEEEEWVAEV